MKIVNTEPTPAQAATLARLGDKWGVSRWNIQRTGTLRVWTDDEDRADIDQYGYTTWRSASRSS